jgi:hypothetical protein
MGKIGIDTIISPWPFLCAQRGNALAHMLTSELDGIAAPQTSEEQHVDPDAFFGA